MRAVFRVLGAALVATGLALGQPANHVYTDDSLVAADTLARAGELVASGNHAEAARALQRLLEDEGDRVIVSTSDPDLYDGVRARVHAAILASPELAAEYRLLFSATAQSLLAAGEIERVESAHLLTPAGFEAALRLTQLHLEAGRFDAARLVIQQLEQHPDRRAKGAADAAALLAVLARYIDRPEVWAAADRWGAQAGAAAPVRQPYSPPPILNERIYSPLVGGVAPPSAGVPSRPLWSQDLAAEPVKAGGSPRVTSPGGALPSRAAAALWIYPTIVGDTMVVNDGATIRALDRFTLEQRWQARPAPAPGIEEQAPDVIRQQRAQRALQYSIEDASTVTVAGPLALSVTGLAQQGTRDGDPRLHAVEMATGRVRWSILVAQLDLRLRHSSVRGPILVSADTAVVCLRKSVPAQRIVSQYLVGIDIWTGAARWVRHVGSAGSLPYQRDRRMADTPAIDRGVVYAADQLGVCGAFDAHTGRPLWVRRTPSIELGSSQTSVSMSWESNGPVVFDHAIALLGADHRDILLLDRDTGGLLARRSANAFGDPWYLLRADTYLVAVGRDQIASIEASRFADFDAPVRATPRLANGAIQGRVVSCGNSFAVPSPAGLTFVNPADPSSLSLVALERTGISLPLGDQVLVVDDGAAHSYLTWEAADGLLAQRMAADPNDPRPAVAAADLAYRGGRHDRIAPTADLALRAVEREPDSDTNVAARARLFDSLFEMLRAVDPASPAATANLPPPLSVAVKEEIVPRLERAAATPTQRVAGAFAIGRLREDQRRAGDAVDAYQRILADPVLSDTLWVGNSHTVRANIEATRRLWDVVRRDGPRVYAAYDARAAAESTALGATPLVEAIESIARRYPAAGAAPGLWLRAADAHEVSGDTRNAITALYSALAGAEMLANGRPLPLPTELGEAGGRLLRTLERADRVAAASHVLASLRARHPGVALTFRGAPIDAASLASELSTRLASVSRFPRVGSAVMGDAQSIEGWTLMPPLSRAGTWLASDHVVLISQARQQIALWGQSGGVWDENSGPDRLQLLWSRPFREKAPVLVRSGPDSVFLFWATPNGATMERIDAVGGRTRWETAPFHGHFPADPAFQQRLIDAGGNAVRFDTPLEGQARLDGMMVALDEEILALVERSGRLALFDVQTGRLLHAITVPIGAVFDLDVAAGRVVVSGIAQTPGHDLGALAATPLTLCYDARAGRLLRRIEPPTGQVRWVRLTADDRVLVAYDGGVTCTSIASGQHLWTMSALATAASLDAWVFGDRMFILNGDRQLFAGSIADGAVSARPIDTRDHLQVASRIDAFRLSPPHTGYAFATSRGVVVVSEHGEVVGMDSVPDDAGMIPPVPAEQVFVALEAVDRVADPNRPGYALHFLAAPDGSLLATHRLLLWDPPSAIAALDGRVVVTAGSVTTVYPVPAEAMR